ncbi:FMN reductase (NADPH) [Lampropedia aestuarii]|uniref:FMN reductase (NADPH) n=1 Tax=Lampropedia aestuarii TaxID=2562762 RepID=A0A4S5C136_9BURK|nr:NAD(P)H-dependent oxidoreductase [Lampropedia aestuarii]THJ36096.1 FMN reductase (NADPH) [Lampropedia aestuarii]
MGIILVNASPVPRSRSAALLAAARQKLNVLGHSPRQLCIADLPSASLLSQSVQEGAIRLAVQAVAQAQAVVIAAPVYQAAFSGLLKVFLDVLPADALQGKTVALLATGVQKGQTVTLAQTIAPVLQSLGAERIVPGVYAQDHQVTLLPEGASYVVHQDVLQRLDEVLQAVLSSKAATQAWWLHAQDSAAFEAAQYRAMGSSLASAYARIPAYGV